MLTYQHYVESALTTIGERYFDIEVGQRLKAARISAGFNQSQLGKALGVTFQQVQKYEAGANRLPANKYPILADAIGFDVTDMLTGDSVYRGKSDVDRDIDKLVVVMKNLSPDERALIINFATRMSKMK